MTTEVRRIRDDELTRYVDALSTGFLDRPDVAKVAEELRPLWDLDRTWGAFEDGRVCGTFRSWGTELTVPGGARLPVGAVSGVTVLPTHRRRGILRSLAAAEHGASRDRGEALTMLYASEYPIYGRFGYGPATRESMWTLDARATGFHGSPTGSIELLVPDLAARDMVIAVHEAWRQITPGEIRRRDYRWDYDLGLRPSAWGEQWKGFLAVHRDDAGSVDGYVRYSAQDTWEQRQPRVVLKVDELHALSDGAHAALWRYVAEIDWVATIKAERRSPSDRLPALLTNARAAALSEVGDGLWVRVVDVERALAARTYERSGRLVIEVVDDASATGRRRVLLDAGPDGATCRATDRSPDLTVDVAALGAVYLGGGRLRDAVVATGCDEHRSGALLEADRLFRTLDEPWCSTFF